MREGFDYSWGRPGPNAIVKAGGTFVVRYLTFPGDNGKGLTSPELAELRKAGLDVAVVYQNGKTQALGGYNAGVNNAQLAERALKDLGMQGWPVYFAVDFDALPKQLDSVEEYFQGVLAILGRKRTGVYGGYRTIDRFWRNKMADWFWQTHAWSNGQVHPAVHLHQYITNATLNNAAVDHNRAHQTEFGQHPVQPGEDWWRGFFMGQKYDTFDDAYDARIDPALKVKSHIDGNVWDLKHIVAFIDEHVARDIPVLLQVKSRIDEGTRSLNEALGHMDEHVGRFIPNRLAAIEAKLDEILEKLNTPPAEKSVTKGKAA